MEDDVEEVNTDYIALDKVTAQDFIPRNGLVTVKRLGKLEDNKAGAIILPDSTMQMDVAKVILVGRGTPGVGGIEDDTKDLEPGQHVLIKTEKEMGPGMRAKLGLKFRIGDGEVELMNQCDILAIIKTEETH
jgi:co-chaperonin GroES (HSP10)